VSIHLFETFGPPGSLNMKFTQGEAKKIKLNLKDSLVSICLDPIKAMEERPMYHNSASQCSLCEGKEGAKGIYISMCFVHHRN